MKYRDIVGDIKLIIKEMLILLSDNPRYNY